MTVRSKVLLSYLLMLLIPALVVVSSGRLLRVYFESARQPGDDRPPSPAQVAMTLSDSMRGINVQILDDPDGFLEPTVIEELAPHVRDLGLVLRKGEVILMTSASLEGVGRLPDFPPFGVVTPAEIPAGLPRETSLVAGQWDFRFSDGAEGSLFMVLQPRPPRAWPFLRFDDLVILVSVMALLMANGFATFLIYRNVVSPLARLEEAAGRISTGDLETPLGHTRSRSDEIGRLNHAFEQMRVRLGESLERQLQEQRSRRELIAGISHDLRTPVTAITGYVEGIRDGVASTPEKTGQYLDTIAEKAALVDQLIEELFLLSTLDTHELPFDWRNVDLGSFLDDSVEELRLRHEAKEITIELERCSEAVIVRADPTRLRRVLENVVENAVRHGNIETPRVIIRLEQAADSGRITVSDNGPGIPAEALPHVFDRFFRADASRTTEGSGLGLAIAKSLIEAHQGSIDAECPQEGGTRILIELPLYGEQAV